MASRLYSDAAAVLSKMEKKQGSLKSLAFSQTFSVSKKKIYALTCQTLKYKPIIIELMGSSRLLHKEPQLSPHLCMVLVYDLLFGKGIQCGGPLKQAINRHKVELKKMLPAAVKKHGGRTQSQQSAHLPRYARVNLLHTTTDDVIKRFCKEGYLLVETLSPLRLAICPSSSNGKSDYQTRRCGTCTQHLAAVDCSSSTGDMDSSSHSSSVKEQQCPMAVEKYVCKDTHIPDLLVFPASSSLGSHPLYANTDIILQDKASCLPSHLLSPLPGSHVIDACAAPGNKTTHLASLMKNQGCIYAFDKDLQRFKILKKMVKKAGATCVKASLQDFLQINPCDYPTVQYILVDPSCSGSGISRRMEFHTEARIDSQRLVSLAAFQKKILRHALNFPSVERVVYSTCSVHEEENELVVASVLQDLSSAFHLVHAMPEWTNRGMPVFEGAEHCIRAIPEEDQTNGFFVALFQHAHDDSETDMGGMKHTAIDKSDRLDNRYQCEGECEQSTANPSAQTMTDRIPIKDTLQHRSKTRKGDLDSVYKRVKKKKNRRFYPVNS